MQCVTDQLTPTLVLRVMHRWRNVHPVWPTTRGVDQISMFKLPKLISAGISASIIFKYNNINEIFQTGNISTISVEWKAQVTCGLNMRQMISGWVMDEIRLVVIYALHTSVMNTHTINMCGTWHTNLIVHNIATSCSKFDLQLQRTHKHTPGDVTQKEHYLEVSSYDSSTAIIPHSVTETVVRK